jgi:hypothetical protein
MGRNFSILPQGPVKGPYPNEKYSKSCKIPKFSFLPPYFDFQFEQFKLQKINQYKNKAIFYFHSDIFIFALCPAAMQCPAHVLMFIYVC